MQEIGKYDEAIDYYDRTLSIKMKTFGKKHPETATTLNDLASLHINNPTKQNLPEAERFYKKSLKIRIEVLGAGIVCVFIIFSSNSIFRTS